MKCLRHEDDFHRCENEAVEGLMYCEEHQADHAQAKPSTPKGVGKFPCIYIEPNDESCKNGAESGSLWCKKHQLGMENRGSTFHNASLFKGVLIGMCLMTITIFVALAIVSV